MVTYVNYVEMGCCVGTVEAAAKKLYKIRSDVSRFVARRLDSPYLCSYGAGTAATQIMHT
jgi:hypothetical protein